MAIKTLTPLQLWQGYDPNEELPQLNIIDMCTSDGVTALKFVYTALNTSMGKTRISADVRYINSADVHPVIIYVEDGTGDIDMSEYIAAGYAVVVCDHLALRGAIYASDIEYAKLGAEGEHIRAKLGADNSALFIRSKVIRRLITALDALPMLAADKVALIGWDESCDIVWQVAAIDKRVGAIAAFLNCGGAEICAATEDEQLRWDIGCSVQANAKFVECNALISLATNSSKYNFDKTIDTIKQLKSGNTRIIINPQLAEQVYDNTISIIKFLKASIVSAAPLIAIPTLSASVTESALTVDFNVDSVMRDVLDVQVYYAYDNDELPEFRNWYAQSVGADMQGRGKAQIKTYSPDESVHIFVQANYKNGLTLSSEPCTVVPSELGEVTLSNRNNRIIYERKLGVSQFVEITNGKIIKSNSVKTIPGAMEILGITSDKGDILTYRIGEIKASNEDAILQFDIYSTAVDSCKLIITDYKRVKYTANVALKSSEEWHKIQLSTSDFKNSDMLSLKSWENVKSLCFIGACQYLINNILWI